MKCSCGYDAIDERDLDEHSTNLAFQNDPETHHATHN